MQQKSGPVQAPDGYREMSQPPVTVSRRRILARTRMDFWLDAVLLTAYVLAYSIGFTGLAVHEWLGLGLGLALLVHLTLHLSLIHI